MYRISFAVVSLALVCSLPRAEEDVPKRPYVIKEQISSIGVPRYRDAAQGAIPFDKAYGELTKQQQAALKSQYEQMDDTDEPPFPVDGLRAIYGPLAKAQNRLLAVGVVSIIVDVDAQGTATAVSILQSPNAAASKLVATLAMLATFKPGRCKGVPCAMGLPLRMDLKVTSGRMNNGY